MRQLVGMPGCSAGGSRECARCRTMCCLCWKFLSLACRAETFLPALQERVEVAEAAPLLLVRRLPGVVRRDRAAKLSLAEAAARGGMGAMLLDRLLPEMAYKLARAPKYGA